MPERGVALQMLRLSESLRAQRARHLRASRRSGNRRRPCRAAQRRATTPISRISSSARPAPRFRGAAADLGTPSAPSAAPLRNASAERELAIRRTGSEGHALANHRQESRACSVAPDRATARVDQERWSDSIRPTSPADPRGLFRCRHPPRDRSTPTPSRAMRHRRLRCILRRRARVRPSNARCRRNPYRRSRPRATRPRLAAIKRPPVRHPWS